MKEIFDNYLENAFGQREQAKFKFIQFEQNYKKYFPVNREAKVLDIGIGRGEMLESVKRWGYRNYLGVDISSSIINFCKSLGYNCELVEDTTKWLMAHQNSFEAITLLDVLEHIPKNSTVEFLDALYGALTPGGTLIIQTPNLQCPDGLLHRYNDFTHEFGYTEHSLQQVLLTAGFKDIKFAGFEEYILDNYKKYIGKLLRSIYWKYVRFTRKITNNLTPEILNPVFYAVVKK